MLISRNLFTKKQEITLNNPERLGYTFIGWIEERVTDDQDYNILNKKFLLLMQISIDKLVYRV
jgi:hypothetical protein